jgi:hypothetical protein
MGTSSGVVLDAFHGMLPWIHAGKVDGPDSPLVTAASMSDGDLSGVVPSSDSLSLSRDCQREMRSSFPEVVVDGTPEMSDAWGSRLVASYGVLTGFIANRWRDEGGK